MKKQLITLLALGAGSAGAIAQTTPVTTGVTLYGLIDTTIRYSTNEDAAGHGKVQMTDGVLTGSRWGLRGTEDLGSGLKSWFILESGFSPDTGTSQQGGRLFGRTAVVGLEGDFGKLALGRQYTLAHEVLSSYEAMAFANNSIVGYQGGNYTGLRYDNTVKYIKSFGGLQVAGAYTFGEVAGSIKNSSAAAARWSTAPARSKWEPCTSRPTTYRPRSSVPCPRRRPASRRSGASVARTRLDDRSITWATPTTIWTWPTTATTSATSARVSR